MIVLFQYQGLITDEYKRFFQKSVPKGVELIFSSESSPDELAKLDRISEIEVFVGYTLSSSLLEVATSLKHIQIPWTGFDRLETSLLKNYGSLTVSNSHSNSLAIAEHAVALMFAASKLLTLRDSKMRKGDWSTRSERVDSFWLTGKTLGIIGYGAIGKKVAKMLKHGFDMKIMGIKRHPEDDDLSDYMGSMNDISLVLKNADFLLVAVPLTEETRGMLGSSELALMKNTSVLVNIARGPIIDEESLFSALSEKKIGAAGIDVWYNYPSRGDPIVHQNYPFQELDNIVMTPHSAFKIRDRVEEFAKDILTNIIHISEGKDPINQVYLDLGY